MTPSEVPQGVVTFLFTDVENSTGRWETDASAMRVALANHDETLREAIAGQGGWLFKHTGDESSPHSHRLDPPSTPRSRLNAHSSSRSEWASPPGRPNYVGTTTLARCSTVQPASWPQATAVRCYWPIQRQACSLDWS